MRRTRDLAGDVLRALGASSRGPLEPKEISRELRLPSAEYESLKATLAELVSEGRVYRVKGNRYALPGDINLAVGAVMLTRAGDGFVRGDVGKDVFVPRGSLGSAMHGDQVVVRIESRPRGRSPVGSVIKVLERARSTVVGTFHEGRRFARVVPLDPTIRSDVMIAEGDGAGAAEEDVVVVRITTYDEGRWGLVGRVERVLGKLSDPGVDVLAVAHGYGLPLDFPAEVTSAAERAATRGLEEPGAGRLDRTDLLVFTIDPADAKDHDDALSVAEVGPGRWEVGIHIADVSHFVRPGDPVDAEALVRGTSVYLVDRTIPMLPAVLSGEVCSLVPDVDRLAVSLFVTLSADGQVHDRRYERTVVRSRYRLSYEEAEGVLTGSEGIAPEVDRALRTLDDLARGVRGRRVERGALDLDLPEARVVLDAQGLPTAIERVERLESHRLIEDFMVLANELVATDAESRPFPVLYRVHEPPSREGREEIGDLLMRLGRRMPSRKALKPRDVQQVLDSVRGRPEEHLVATVVLRAMERARYDPQNLGHFGLASSAYLHFTSPIRRYPDLVVHREVTRVLIDHQAPSRVDPAEMADLGVRTSERERAADEAERDSVALKKVEFMERHLGDEFDGRISGVVSFGFFVTLDEYFVEGLVHVNALTDDFYRLDDAAYALVGRRGNRRYRIGDRVRVQVSRVDKEARHVDFQLVRKLQRASVDTALRP